VGEAPSIADGLASSARFVATAWRQAWAALALACLACGGLLSAIDLGAPAAWKAAWLGAALLAVTIARGVLYRQALGRSGAGPGGLQWRRTEWRLLAVWLLTALFLAILALLLLTALIAAAYAVASAGAGFVAAQPATWGPAVDGRGRLVLGAVGAAGAAAFAWAALRLCLAPAATVARGRVQVLSAWPLTRRRAWRLRLALAVAAAPAAIVLAAVSIAGEAAPPSPVTAAAIGLAQGLAVGGLWLPMSVGLMAYLYRRGDPPAPGPRP
jgi:hypothetical protein